MQDESQSFSRRNIVVGATALGVLCAVGAPALTTKLTRVAPKNTKVLGSAKAPHKKPPPLGGLEEWTAAVGSEFLISTNSGKIPARLALVTPVPTKGQRPAQLARQQGFSVVLDTGRNYAPQGEAIYSVVHTGPLGRMQLFLTSSLWSDAALIADFN